MNRIEEVFGARRVLLPVVHPVNRDEALRSAMVAWNAGVRGVFVIDQGMSRDEVLDLILRLRHHLPALWVGLNLLGTAPAEILRLGLAACEGRLDGIWTDNANIHEDAAEQPAARAFLEARAELGWRGLYFGGVAFKYQRVVPADRLRDAASAARPFMDVLCTSGPGTGQAAEVAKVAALREGLGPDGSLALASGVAEDNVADFLPHVDAYLVGTSLEKDFGVLDAGKVARLHALVSGGKALRDPTVTTTPST